MLHVNHDPAVQQWILSRGTREDIIGWLAWNDHNGTFTDRDSDAEGIDRLTLESARQLMAEILARDAA